MTEIYLDNSATTKVSRRAAETALKVMREDYGNPSSMHNKGVEAEKYVRDAKKTIAGLLGAADKEIYFTSGGTESDNWALFGTFNANKRRGAHIITTRIEHPAITSAAEALEGMGAEVTYLSHDEEGNIDLNELKNAIRPDTILVSVMSVNNETGTMLPIEQIGKLVKEANPETYFHTDAVQAFGKLKINVKKAKIDMLSVSSHKIHGPKGIGFLYIGKNVKIKPILFGGGQQNGYRSGTDNVPGIAAMAEAAAEIYEDHAAKTERMYALKKAFTDRLLAMENVCVNGPLYESGAPHIVNASFMGVRSEVLLHSLEDKGIYVSAGSACSSHKRAGSPVLTAMGLSKERMESALRFSFSDETTKEELEYTADALEELLPVLRRFTRR